METNVGASIRWTELQFSTEIAEIRRARGPGRCAAVLPGAPPDFWAACDAICSRKWWRPFGVLNCGKGEPGQIARMTHGSAPARFRKIRVGVSE
jgi:TldD protein